MLFKKQMRAIQAAQRELLQSGQGVQILQGTSKASNKRIRSRALGNSKFILRSAVSVRHTSPVKHTCLLQPTLTTSALHIVQTKR
jgi:hypothetical protein